jgi:gamma-glutamylcyclotransferase (GGCT)/AIG2-like uncharacterized protein YtfP
MCLIIHKPTAESEIPEFILDNAERINPDGFGIVYTDNNECVRTMDYQTARELISAQRPFVAHYRYATRGSIGKAGCHPYIITGMSQNNDDVVRLFSNGTVADLGDDQLCDTKVVAKMLMRIPSEHWSDVLSMTDTRFVICSKDITKRYGEWHERDGIYYSKANCFHKSYHKNIGYSYPNNYQTYKGYDKYWYDEDLTDDDNTWDTEETTCNTPVADKSDWQNVDLVAVYGTLKAGRSNNSTLGESHYIGAGHTVYKYPMQASGIPFVYDIAGEGHNITVEVYNVTSDEVKDSCDWLEGHPNNYERKLTDIQMADGSVKTCWLYFMNPYFYDETMTNIRTY